MVNPNTSELYAAIDMGSNSFHMLVVRLKNGHVQILNKIKQKVRLAEGLDEDNVLAEQSIERGLGCLKTFAERLQDIPSQNIQAVATATLRLAKNSQHFVDRAEAILGCPINVISGLEEARQIYMGVAYTSTTDNTRLVIDIGGASTELIVGQGIEPIELASLNMGCVTFAGQYFPDGILSRANFENGLAAARKVIEPLVDTYTAHQWSACVGASGTPQAVNEILVAQQVNDNIRLNYLYELMELCIACKTLEKLNIDGLVEERKQIFHSGLVILIALFETLDIKDMTLSGGALREGLLYGMLETREQHSIQFNGISVISEHFHVDQVHAEHVANMADSLYVQCEPNVYFDGAVVLRGACKLHEVGLHIDYKLSHKHGAYLLDHTKLNGYTRLQQSCIRDLVGHYRQPFTNDIFSHYSATMQPGLLMLLRIFRVSVAFAIRRESLKLPKVKLEMDGDVLRLTCPDGWLSENLLVKAELEHEKWLQFKAGLTLDIL